MANLNKVMLIGNLTRDPEVKYLPKGGPVAEFGLAVNRSYTLDNGEKREETTFVDIVTYNKLAEIVEKYLKKGRSVYVEGRLKLETWDDKQTGQKRSKMRIVGEVMQMLGGRDSAGSGGASEGGYGGEEYGDSGRSLQRPPSRPSARPAAPSDPDLDPTGDEIPF
jgi:single-strand DNA-binding protein